MIKSAAGNEPEIASGAYIAETAVITGDVTVMPGASIWFGAVLRGDSGAITIGERVNIQDNVVIHEETFVDHDVTVGHCAILHGCRIEPHCLIGMHATVMDGAVIGEGSYEGSRTALYRSRGRTAAKNRVVRQTISPAYAGIFMLYTATFLTIISVLLRISSYL